MYNEEKSPEKIIEEGIGTIGKIRILRTLAIQNKMCTIYMIQKYTSLKREDIKRILRDLTELGWVNEVDYGKKIYCLNKQNKYVKHLLVFFYETGYIDKFFG